MIHYSAFAARRASSVPLLAAIAGLAVIGLCVGNPQAGVGAAPAAHVPGAISLPDRWNDEISLRARHSSGAPAAASLPSGPTAPPAVVALFNRDRAAAGQPPLTESVVLDAIASTRARQMVTDGLTHIRPGRTVMAATELLQQYGVTYTWNGENIFWAGGPPFDDAVSAADAWWMNSPEHRDNILGSHFRQVGIGTAIDGDKMYISAVFTD